MAREHTPCIFEYVYLSRPDSIFEDVSIYWQHISLGFGNHSLNWQFPESMPQTQMIDIIEQELSVYERKLIAGQ